MNRLFQTQPSIVSQEHAAQCSGADSSFGLLETPSGAASRTLSDTDSSIAAAVDPAGDHKRSPGNCIKAPAPCPSFSATPRNETWNSAPSPDGPLTARLPLAESPSREAGVCNEERGAVSFPADPLPQWPAGTRKCDIEAAQADAALCQRFLDLKEAGHSGNTAAEVLGRAASWFSAHVPQYLREGAAGLLPKVRDCGRKPSEDAQLWTETDCARVRHLYLKSNLGKNAGSLNGAILKYAECADCPPALREQILTRYGAGKALALPSIVKRLQISKVTFAQYRNPTEANLTFVNAPGSMMWLDDPSVPGGRRFIRGGDVIEADDGTKNFVCWIPWAIGGCKCSDRYGVKPGRFQWLVFIDAGTRFVPVHLHVARPMGSYRGEDAVTGMNAIAREHGEPEIWRFEQGVFKSNAIKRRVRYTGAQLWTVHSPRNKPFVEGLFHTAWTYLSMEVDGQVGRFQGEMEKENDLLAACLDGRLDPRAHFASLPQMLAALDKAVAFHNRHIVRSEHYGEWIPAERWQQHLAQKPMRSVSTEIEWLAAPWVKAWTVKGNLVGGAVRLFDGYSAPFHFTAPWLHQFSGAVVECHFDPTAGRCTAMVTLAQPFGGRAAGEVLGQAVLIDECASYARLVMQFGDDDRSAGRRERAKTAQAMRRDVRIVKTNGQLAATSEARDGLGNAMKVDGQRAAAVPTSEEQLGGRSVSCGNAPDVNGVGHAPALSGLRKTRSEIHASPASTSLTPTDRAARLRALEAAEAEASGLLYQ